MKQGGKQEEQILPQQTQQNATHRNGTATHRNGTATHRNGTATGCDGKPGGMGRVGNNERMEMRRRGGHGRLLADDFHHYPFPPAADYSASAV